MKTTCARETVMEAVQCVTHRREESYADYVVGCKHNPIALQVKLGDLTDNCQLDRSILRPQRRERDLARIHRYFLSYRFLTDQLSETEYRSLMEKVG